LKRELLSALLAARAGRHGVALITDLESGSQRLVPRAGAAGDPLAERLDEAFRFDQSGTYEGQFINIYNPPLRLVVIGAVHIAQSLIPMAQQLGYDVTVIDPRGAFATEMRFPGVALRAEWPDEVLATTGLDQRTALVALTHDPKIDDPALAAALRAAPFYIGALGSKKTQAARVERLCAAGFSEQEIARIHAPIGLAIGARGAPEIAVSIMAEMTRTLRLGA
jgi:xanthine dehydrogenase accessory factor